ncbi:MAG: TnpV protein [Coriobacteriales bacterium]|nr:TnpV protein [Coriobacteriales bacterium]
MELTYSETEQGYLLPDLIAPMETTLDIGTWGRRRKRYLKEHRPGMYAVMKMQGTLFSHLVELNWQAEAMWERLTEQLAKSQKVDAAMKMRDPLEWAGRMNNIRSQATETVASDLICC